MSARFYAIGDIHGHLDQLRMCHERIARDRITTGLADAPVIHLGDMVDRGPDSKGVIAFLLEGRDRGENWITLMGNHDRSFLKFLTDPGWRDPILRPDYTWLHPNMGGRETLASYGVNAPADGPPATIHRDAANKIPARHVGFLESLPLRHLDAGIMFVHAGIRPDVPLDDQREDDLVWIRDEFHRHTGSHGPLIIHGHAAIRKATHYGNRVNIDTGAGWGREATAIVIEGRDVWRLTRNGREALLPPGET